ncbi:LOW QUALITY PROTEIN: uncharacterized protein ACR2FA_008521 [Aphomia sociella]
MDETQQNKTSEAAATRKRRSSILKSQRPPRTPFSELEFNVATPDNTTKSRRVSFSRRTGVAEFVTNEATTTWKNFYEEHNKSLESSGNEPEAHAPRPPIGHIGKRIFDQQFEEVDAVDFLTSLDTLSNRNVSSSLNNVNFTEQLASIECATNGQLPIPSNNFELSAFTELHSKVFGDDLVIPAMGEMSGRIDVNFSAMQTIGGDDKDDLDEIQRDLQNNKNNVVGPGCFKGGRDMSEYIEVDLNMTHVNLRNEESDMSITDTIHSPKVQEVSKTNSSQIDVKASLSKDWAYDKENIAINPYVTPKESLNFAVNDESDKVLVFDGKRLTLQCGKEADAVLGAKNSHHMTSDKAKRKTVVINVNDDLPNFGEISSVSLSKNNVSKHSVLYDDVDLSITQALPSKFATTEKRKTIVYDENSGNISVTQAVPTNIILAEKNNPIPEKKTIVYENDTCNISITQAVSSNIIIPTKKETIEKRRTIVYEDDTGNISMTQALPTNIMSQDRTHAPDKRKTIIYESDSGDISMTQAIPGTIFEKHTDKNKTLHYDDGACDISMTQAVPSNLILPTKTEERRRTVVFDNDTGNISVTQAIPANVILSNVEVSDKSKSIVYFDDKGDISVTQAVPANLLLPKAEVIEKRRTIVYEDDTGNISVTQAVPSNIIINQKNTIVKEEKVIIATPQLELTADKIITASGILSRQPSLVNEKGTIVFDGDEGDISMTQIIPTNIPMETIISEEKPFTNVENEMTCQSYTILNQNPNKRRTIVYENNTENISVTQALPTNIVLSNTAKTVYENKDVFEKDLPMETLISEKIPFTNVENEITCQSYTILNKNSNKRRTIVYENDTENISVTESVPTNIVLSNIAKTISENKDVIDKDLKDITMTHAIDNNLLQETNDFLKKTMLFNDADLSMTETCNDHIEKANVKRRTVVFDTDGDNADMSITVTVPQKIQENIIESEKRKTIVFLDETGNLSMTKPIPTNLISMHSEILSKSKMDDDNLNQHTKSFYEKSALNHTNQDIFVYQAAACSPISQSRTEQGDTNAEESNDSYDKIEGSTVKLDNTVGLVESATGNVGSQEEIMNSVHTHSFTDAHERKYTDINNRSLSSTINIESSDKPAKEIDKFVQPDTKSMLDNLLDMSNASMESGLNDKNLMTQIESNHPSRESPLKVNSESSSDMFLIIRDNNEETQTVGNVKEIDYNVISVEDRKSFMITNKSPGFDKTSLEYKEDVIPEIINELQKSLSEIKEYKEETSCPLTNRHYEKCISPDIKKEKENLNKSHKLDASKCFKSYKEADNTKELLEMLSDFTDRRSSCDTREDENPLPVKVKGNIALENKSAIIEPRRISVAPNRQSIVLSREDLLNNISMAQAALQMSLEMDESDNIDDSSDTPMDESTPPKKSVRVSNEVVKTLHFEEDESISDNSNKSEIRMSPLKKTAFGETSYMKESKANVIPTYLKDVSDGIKALMSDLVKPIADAFDNVGLDKSIKKSPSICSTQIQANLTTSSQIEMDVELYSNTESAFNLTKSAPSNISGLDKTSSYKSPIKPKLSESEMAIDDFKDKSFRPKRSSIEQTSKVLVFDHDNPLNNVLLVPTDFSDVHKYNPSKSNVTLCGSDRNQSVQHLNLKEELQEEHVSTHHKVENVNMLHSIQKIDTETEKVVDTQSTISNLSKPMSIDQSIDVKLMEVKDIEVNTLIAMKENKELLEASSSLTLVDDALTRSTFDINLDIKPASEDDISKRKSQSPVEIIYKKEQLDKMDSDITSNDEPNVTINSKKRNYSPIKDDKHKNSTLSSVDVTPKPASKIQKLSDTPNTLKNIGLHLSPEKLQLTAEKDESNSEMEQEMTDSDMVLKSKKSPRKAKTSPKCKKPLTNITVQQLMTEYNIDPKVNQELNMQILEALSKTESSIAPNTASQSDAEGANSPDIVSSFTSSRNQMRRVREQDSDMTMSTDTDAVSNGKDSKSFRQPEAQTESSSVVSECDSSANVVAKIDMLPFMGSHECEWESSGTDTWSFRLLHSRLRLTVRLEHRHHNAIRTRVRADTPVLSAVVETTHHGNDKKNSVATLCVGFAAEAMRYYVAGCSRAGDVPVLLRRCSGVARVAIRWGRAMQDARMHLAYTLSDDGRLTLKVANIPLRCVWEVSLRLELTSGEGAEPYPRAGAPQIRCLLAERAPPERELRRVLSGIRAGWGHAPRSIWKIFKYLKRKTQDDYLLGV